MEWELGISQKSFNNYSQLNLASEGGMKEEARRLEDEFCKDYRLYTCRSTHDIGA